MRAVRHSVDVFIIIKSLGNIRRIGCIFNYRKSNVGLERHQLSTRIGKGYYSVGQEELFISAIKVVFLKLAHLEAGVAVRAIKASQIENYLFLALKQTVIYSHFLFSSNLSIASLYPPEPYISARFTRLMVAVDIPVSFAITA